MSDTGAARYFEGHISGTLYINQADVTLQVFHFTIGYGANRARVAVLENDHRTVVGTTDQLFQHFFLSNF